MAKYKISINAPSYRRPEGVDTLKYIPDAKIWVDEGEAKAYWEANHKANIVPCPPGVQGNLCRVRNYILDQENAAGIDAVCLIDDDFQYFFYYEGKKRVRVEPDQLMPFLQKYTLLAMELGVKMWGVNVTTDKQSYREYTPFSMLSYIGGPFSVHLQSDLRYDEALPLKEDYDMTIQHLNKYRKVLRLNKFFYSVKQGGSGSGQTGGCAVYRNLEREKEQLFALQRKWGREIVKIDDGKSRSHNSKKVRKFDINPIIRVPISGV